VVSFKSEITKKLLKYFFLNPEGAFYLNELFRELGVDKRNLAKKLKELQQEGIFKSQEQGNLKYYSLNRGYLLYDEYKKVILKTMGIEDKIKKL